MHINADIFHEKILQQGGGTPPPQMPLTVKRVASALVIAFGFYKPDLLDLQASSAENSFTYVARWCSFCRYIIKNFNIN